MRQEIYYEINSPEDLLDCKNKLELGRIQMDMVRCVTSANRTQRIIEWRLTRDIDMTGVDWTPINILPHDSDVIRVLNGDGHSIRGLYSRPVESVFIPYEDIPPVPGAKSTDFVYPVGMLFLAQHKVRIQGLTLQGTLDLRDIQKIHRYNYQSLATGGITGILGAGSAISDCSADTAVILPEEERTRIRLRYGGIAGANLGEIENCIYSGTSPRDLSDIKAAGIAFFNPGYIKDSYTEPVLCPEVYERFYSINKTELLSAYWNAGLVDNIGLYMPGGPYHTGNLEEFFRSETLQKLANWDVFLGRPQQWSYWNQNAIEKIIKVVEALAEEGAEFGSGVIGAAALSTAPFKDFYRLRKTKEEALRSRGRYSITLERLATESPAFRRAILAEWDDDPEGVWNTISEHITSRRRAESIFNKARKYHDYSLAVDTDNEFIDCVYER